MLIQNNNLTIRNATSEDAAILWRWWNDGKVMAHAGFPNGLGISEEEIIQQLSADADESGRCLIIEMDEVPVGEMNYSNQGNNVAEIGIKICDFSRQEKAHGRKFLSMLINTLF